MNLTSYVPTAKEAKTAGGNLGIMAIVLFGTFFGFNALTGSKALAGKSWVKWLAIPVVALGFMLSATANSPMLQYIGTGLFAAGSLIGIKTLANTKKADGTALIGDKTAAYLNDNLSVPTLGYAQESPTEEYYKRYEEVSAPANDAFFLAGDEEGPVFL